jgi:hypothetical protein
VNHFRPIFCDSSSFILPPHDEAGDVLKEDERHAAQIAELNEMCGFECRLGEQHTIIRDDAYQEAMQPGEPRDECGAITLFELVESRPVNDPRNYLAHVVRLSDVGIHNPVDLVRVVRRLFGCRHVHREDLVRVERADDRSCLPQRMLIIFSQIVGDPR